jgi:hypothetical protein
LIAKNDEDKNEVNTRSATIIILRQHGGCGCQRPLNKIFFLKINLNLQ